MMKGEQKSTYILTENKDYWNDKLCSLQTNHSNAQLLSSNIIAIFSNCFFSIFYPL